MIPPPPVRPQASREGHGHVKKESEAFLRCSCEGQLAGRWCKVRRMFAHSTQNWWWTAHPAAH
ncbi:trp operon leader peptide [Streptomyces sp. NPDC005799]|uniref:trp operon leader peptide n=1 Tax=Streptomyces sp. NPDC005799 TaxID=3154678 RepID=UPI0033FB97D4